MRAYPALDVLSDTPDLLLAIVDDFEPTAVEERQSTIRVFFGSAAARDSARAALSPRFEVVSVDVPDNDWARRSQEQLAPVTVGRITLCPNPRVAIPHDAPPFLSLVIQPSMGFGTGHHATTRLCLAALQAIDLTNAFVLDVGTGSGVLAMTAACLGATRALGVDIDPDAIQSARENLTLNANVRGVEFERADLTEGCLPQADVVTANLTGAQLVRTAAILRRSVGPGGTLIVSGILSDERESVFAAFGDLTPTWENTEDGWVGAALRAPQSR